jgi:hypothetical protein
MTCRSCIWAYTRGWCISFNPEVSGHWGGEPGQGAVAAFDNSDPRVMSISILSSAGKAVSIRHLDGTADDSFDLFVNDVHGAWIKVGHCTDKAPGSQNDTEAWLTTQSGLTRDINGKRVNLAEGRTIEIQIMPTALGWWGFDTWGQLAIDEVDLLGQGWWQPLNWQWGSKCCWLVCSLIDKFH